jgi:hypothetical protein
LGRKEALRMRLRELAANRVRFGYRWFRVLTAVDQFLRVLATYADRALGGEKVAAELEGIVKNVECPRR